MEILTSKQTSNKQINRLLSDMNIDYLFLDVVLHERDVNIF